MSSGVRLTTPVRSSWLVEFAENLAAGITTYVGNIFPFGRQTGSYTLYTTPRGEVTHILGIISTGVIASGADGDLVLVIDGNEQPVGKQLAQTNTTLPNADTDFSPSIVIPGGSTLIVRLKNYAAAGATVTQQLQLKVLRVPIPG